MSTPFLSIILTGRNDNHNGDFDRRAELAIHHNSALLKKHGLAIEWIWVEWNPLADKPLFAEKLKTWVSPLRTYVVSPAIHRHCCDNPHIGVMQFLAKNVGIRRARGEWILSMNADTYLTDEVFAAGKKDPDTLYLATRVDFDSRHLNDSPGDLEQLNVVRTSEIRLPNGFGSAGDFTLMHRDLFFKTGGHFEGIRFSNKHLDTLLGRQVLSLGGKVRVLGRVFHADHADSWNNFTLDDAFAHHHGADFNSMKISVPYHNPESWGLADYSERQTAPGTWALAGTNLRPDIPTAPVIPPNLDGVARATEHMIEALKKARRDSLKIVIYGLGDQLRESILKGALSDIRFVGFIDDHRAADPALPMKSLNWETLEATAYDALLIGSFYWANELKAKALEHVGPEKIL